jgi:hypothetical protein
MYTLIDLAITRCIRDADGQLACADKTARRAEVLAAHPVAGDAVRIDGS